MVSISFTDIINNGLLPVVIILILTGIIKLYFDSRIKDYEKKIEERYKEKDREFSLIIENHKKELDLVYFKSSKLHDKRLDIISDLYSKLVLLEFGMKELTKPMKLATGNDEKDAQIEKDLEKTAGNAYNDFHLFFSKHRIFFSTEIASLIDKIREEYFESLFNYTYRRRYTYFDKAPSHYTVEIEATNKVFEEIPKLKIEIENEFREIMNVDTHNNY